MSNKVKDINKKNHRQHFIDDIINIKDFDVKNIKTDAKSYKNILIYYIGYLKIYCVNRLYIIFNKVNGYFEEINGSKHLTLVPTNESKEKINMENYGVKLEI